jgi:hypothetical protein
MPPKDFFSLGDAEAEAFFEQYTARAKARLDEFRREVSATGGPELDGTPESLVPLWRWFVARPAEPGGELPPWYEPDPPEVARERLPASTLRDADGIALYLAQVFGHPWGIGREPPRKRYVSQNKPVLKASGHDVDVLQIAYNLALRAAEGRDTDDEALLRTFRAWG